MRNSPTSPAASSPPRNEPPMIPGLMAHRILEQQSIDFAPDCARIQAPTMIVTGEPGLDRIVPVESTMRYLDMIPGACHARIPRTGHLGLVTKPELFGGVVGRFAAVNEAARRVADAFDGL